MKRMLFFTTLLLLALNELFASGSKEEQSQALLYRQKRTTWTGASDSTVFYECYLVKHGDDVILLDTLVRTAFLKAPILIVNSETSMKIDVHNEDAMLKRPGTLYKCVVLESGGLMGRAIVNAFSAEPVTMKIGYVRPDYFSLYYYTGYDWSSGYNENILVFFANEKKVLKIDQWPNPTVFNEQDVYQLIDDGYRKFLSEHPNLTAAQKQEVETEYKERRSSETVNKLLGSFSSENVWRIYR
ncbi:MAG: hypothetical protein LBS97_02880 [Treponema sp.]|jgi:hypothetical protein|nr:hypothetical protein [Treponema sp.]